MNMGNETSSTSSDSEHEETVYYKSEEDKSSDSQNSDDDVFTNLDLNQLFDITSLRLIVSKFKDIIPENVLHKHQVYLIRILNERLSSNDRTISIADFCDVLMNKSIAREDAIQLFQQFDSEGDGTADVEAMLEAVRSATGPTSNGEMVYVIRSLQACSLTPGFLDAFLEDKQTAMSHGSRILNFLIRNRTATSVMPFFLLDGFTMTDNMRTSALKHYFDALDEAALQQKEDQWMNCGEELKPIVKCVKSIEVSSNKGEAYMLLNDDFTTCWQSDGSARSHWVRLYIRSGVVLKHLSIAVSSSDTSYMPQVVAISVGNTPQTLKHIKEVRIDSQITGDAVLLENVKKHFPVVQLNVRRCHSDGCDTRIRGVKTLGYRVVKESRVSIADASVTWLLQIISSTATMSVPHNPALRDMIIAHSKLALQSMSPLSLATPNAEKPKYMSSYVLDQMDTLLHQLVTMPDDEVTSDALHVLLAFSLARGHVVRILNTLILMFEKNVKPIDCAALMRKLTHVTNTFWRKSATSVVLDALGCYNVPKEKADNNEPPSDLSKNALQKTILTSVWSTFTPSFMSEKGIAKVDLFFAATECIQVTQIRIKLDKTRRAAHRGFVFVYDKPGPFDLVEHAAHFAQYDDWSTEKYARLQRARSKHSLHKTMEPIASFLLDDDWDEIDVPLDHCHIGKYVCIKILLPESAIAKKESVGIVGIRIFGIPRSNFIASTFYMDCMDLRYDYANGDNGVENKTSASESGGAAASVEDGASSAHSAASTSSSAAGSGAVVSTGKPSTAANVNSEHIARHVLVFLSHFSRDQNTIRKTSPHLQSPQLLNMQGVHIKQLWTLYQINQQQRDNSAIIRQCVLLNLLNIQIPHLIDTADESTKEYAKMLFSHICALIDEDIPTTDTTAAKLLEERLALAKHLLVNGAALFFPDKKTRREQLFSKMVEIKSSTTMRSSQLTFQSLCQYFSNVDPSELLNLPNVLDEENDIVSHFDSNAVIQVMDTLLTVTTVETSHNILTVCALPHTEAQAGAAAGTDPQQQEAKQAAESKSTTSRNNVNRKQAAAKAKQNKDNSLSDTASAAQAQLVRLLCSLQSSLLSWVHRQLRRIGGSDTSNKKDKSDDKEKLLTKKKTKNEKQIESDFLHALLVQYVGLVCDKTLEVLRQLCKCSQDEVVSCVDILENSFFSSLFRQMLLALGLLVEHVVSDFKIQLLRLLEPLSTHFIQLVKLAPQFFYRITSSSWDLEMSEEIFRTWEVESAHNYSNNQNITLSFVYPGATQFVVEFDPKCETERRYDYLEFLDSHGDKVRYDHRVGTEKWPLKVTFARGNALHFTFHSDSSNTEWGYKFKVTASGCPEVPLCWIFDVQLSLNKLQGQICGAILDTKQVLPATLTLQSMRDNEATAEIDVLRSELWATLFRGGYRKDKDALQRSYSGRHVATSDDDVLQFLLCMVNDPNSESSKAFLTKCLPSSGDLSIYSMGGDAVSHAVRAVFAALIWHTQHIRDDMSKYVQSTIDQLGRGGGAAHAGSGVVGTGGGAWACKITEGIEQAFTVAETIRRYLIEKHQKFKQSADRQLPEDDEVDPVTLCQEKGLYLLLFSGLSKVNIKTDLRNKQSKQASRHGFKVDSMLDRNPSFRLVLEFIKNPIWSKQRVDELIVERRTRAQCISQAYMYASEFLRINNQPTPLELPCILFLRELLSHQEKFGRHYAAGIDGCGLLLESNVRRAYYTLVRYLIKIVNSVNDNLARSEVLAYNYIVACTLHLLDVDWQLYDLEFVNNIELPKLLMTLAKRSVSTRTQLPGAVTEEKQLATYKQEAEWHKTCEQVGSKQWYNDMENSKDKQAVQMFVAKYCDLLNFEISCDGCNATLPGRRYRCLNCQDVDLCASCYIGGVNPGGNHAVDHEFVHMMYKCDSCQAFIVGDRYHCNICEDYDLCLGCHHKKEYPGGHLAEHEVTKHAMMKWKYTTKLSKSSTLLTYIHQHVWLLFSALTLQLTNTLYCSTPPTDMETDALPPAPHTPTDTAHDKPGDVIKIANQDGKNMLESTNVVDDAKAVATLPVSPPPLPQHVTSAAEAVAHDSDYTKFCAQLHAQCLQQLMACMKIPTIDIQYEESDSTSAVLARQEQEFIAHSQERIMGLLGAIIPPENRICISEEVTSDVFTSEPFLTLLYTNIRMARNEDDVTTLMALGLLSQLLQRSNITREVSDEAVCNALKDEYTPGSDGEVTINFLFSIGAQCLARSDLQWSRSVAQLLRSLYNCPIWRNQLMSTLASAISELENADKYMSATAAGTTTTSSAASAAANDSTESTEQASSEELPSLESVFALFIIAGFPEVLCIGTSVKCSDSGKDQQNAVILKPFPDKQQTLVVTKRDRRRKMVKDEHITTVATDAHILDEKHIPAFLQIIINVVTRIKSGNEVSVRTMWVLGLCLKAVLGSINATTLAQFSQRISSRITAEFYNRFFMTQMKGAGSGPAKNMPPMEMPPVELLEELGYCPPGWRIQKEQLTVFSAQFIQCIVFLTIQDTGLPKTWLLKDLEILSLLLYSGKQEKSGGKSSAGGAATSKIKPATSEAATTSTTTSDATATTTTATAAAATTTTTTAATTTATTTALSTVVLSSSASSNDTSIATTASPAPSPSGLAPTSASASASSSDSVLFPDDTLLDPFPQLPEKMMLVSPVEWPCTYTTETLMSSKECNRDLMDQQTQSGDEAERGKASQAKESSRLLKDGLTTKAKQYKLLEINRAISLLYARKLLMSLLGNWPAGGPNITYELIGCKQDAHVPFVLDLLSGGESQEAFKKLVSTVIIRCRTGSLLQIAATACFFMKEKISTNVEEKSRTRGRECSGHMRFHGATELTVTYEHSYEGGLQPDDVVKLCTKPNFHLEKIYELRQSKETWCQFNIPGDRLYYHFKPNHNFDWSFKFKVTAALKGHFNTGYVILHAILKLRGIINLLPLEQIWRCLIYVATQQKEERRLQAIQLLLMICKQQRKPRAEILRIDLTLLRLIWMLYRANIRLATSNVNAEGRLLPPIVRALTELFTVVEELVDMWDMRDEYLISLRSEVERQQILLQGIANVAAVSYEIGHSNWLLDTVLKLRVPPSASQSKNASSGSGLSSLLKPSTSGNGSSSLNPHSSSPNRAHHTVGDMLGSLYSMPLLNESALLPDDSDDTDTCDDDIGDSDDTSDIDDDTDDDFDDDDDDDDDSSAYALTDNQLFARQALL